MVPFVVCQHGGGLFRFEHALTGVKCARPTSTRTAGAVWMLRNQSLPVPSPETTTYSPVSPR